VWGLLAPQSLWRRRPQRQGCATADTHALHVHFVDAKDRYLSLSHGTVQPEGWAEQAFFELSRRAARAAGEAWPSHTQPDALPTLRWHPKLRMMTHTSRSNQNHTTRMVIHVEGGEAEGSHVDRSHVARAYYLGVGVRVSAACWGGVTGTAR
jgi:hypothetical protein